MILTERSPESAIRPRFLSDVSERATDRFDVSPRKLRVCLCEHLDPPARVCVLANFSCNDVWSRNPSQQRLPGERREVEGRKAEKGGHQYLYQGITARAASRRSPIVKWLQRKIAKIDDRHGGPGAAAFLEDGRPVSARENKRRLFERVSYCVTELPRSALGLRKATHYAIDERKPVGRGDSEETITALFIQ
jgi:hypothetical protein